MSESIFFSPKGPFYLKQLIDKLNNDENKIKVYDIKTLDQNKLSSLEMVSFHELLMPYPLVLDPQQIRSLFQNVQVNIQLQI